MPLYDPTGSGLLSAESAALVNRPTVDAEGGASNALLDHADLAEDLLGIADEPVRVEAPKVRKLRRAVALQVNHQVALGGDATALTMLVKGSRTQQFRGGGGAPPILNPLAADLVAEVRASEAPAGRPAAWSTVRSLRPRAGDGSL